MTESDVVRSVTSFKFGVIVEVSLAVFDCSGTGKELGSVSVGVVEEVGARVCGAVRPLFSRIVDTDKCSVSWVETVRLVFAERRHDDTK